MDLQTQNIAVSQWNPRPISCPSENLLTRGQKSKVHGRHPRTSFIKFDHRLTCTQ